MKHHVEVPIERHPKLLPNKKGVLCARKKKKIAELKRRGIETFLSVSG